MKDVIVVLLTMVRPAKISLIVTFATGEICSASSAKNGAVTNGEMMPPNANAKCNPCINDRPDGSLPHVDTNKAFPAESQNTAN